MSHVTFFLGKLLFPRLPPDLRRRRINIIYMVLVVGLPVAGAVAYAMFKVHGAGPP